ncbi:MAG TPA: type II toxin-antitoxin system HicB family antitoxin [Beijerinckiaceae bacterium]|nr:type II toxin-antitoxin system HicB family antitoxin [Beijerinckiaceae bacterium]
MADLFYPVVICALSDEDGGGYLASVPDLPGCMSDGDTPEEALANVRLAVREWRDEMLRLGRPIPEPGPMHVPRQVRTGREEAPTLRRAGAQRDGSAQRRKKAGR